MGLCSVFDMVIFNGLKSWPKSGCIMFKTYNRQSIVDYVICLQNLIAKVLDFKIGVFPLELNSDHMPLFVKMDFT